MVTGVNGASILFAAVKLKLTLGLKQKPDYAIILQDKLEGTFACPWPTM
jgi:hypothetical protein